MLPACLPACLCPHLPSTWLLGWVSDVLPSLLCHVAK